MDAQVGRAIAAVGVVLAVVAIWTDAVASRSYWSLDGTVGAFLLIMVILAGLALVGAVAGQAGCERALLTIGAVLVGFYGFFPAALATDQWDVLDAGGWLGLCGGALITVGALIVLMPARGETRTMAAAAGPPMGALLAALGLVLAFVALWVKVDNGGGSYWNAPELGHSLGIVMLIALILAAVGLAGVVVMRSAPAAGLAALGGLIACGLFIFIPVGDAFNDLGQLRAGGWLGFFGGLLLAIGVVMLSKSVMAGAATRPAPTAPTATTPPAATA